MQLLKKNLVWFKIRLGGFLSKKRERKTSNNGGKSSKTSKNGGKWIITYILVHEGCGNVVTLKDNMEDLH